MRQADYPYPPDEFDAAASSGGPRGAHRTPQSAWSKWWPFLVVVILFPALAFGAVTLISNGGLPGGSGAAADPSASSSAPSESASSAAPSDTASESPSQTPTPTETPTPEPDLTTSVQVENATNTSGLAGKARDTLDAGGFTDVSVGNWGGPSVGTTVVFYPAAADLGTADQVATLLGISRVEEDATQAPDGIVVVLESDFTP